MESANISDSKTLKLKALNRQRESGRKFPS
jgi:hypothetical protein